VERRRPAGCRGGVPRRHFGWAAGTARGFAIIDRALEITDAAVTK